MLGPLQVGYDKANMRVGLQIAVDRVLPVRQLIRLAVDYANLKLPEPAALRKLVKWPLREQRDRIWFQHPIIRLAGRVDLHAWVRALMDAASDGKPLSEEDATDLYELIHDETPTLPISFKDGGFDAYISVPKADLFWFVGIGCAALFDRHSAYRNVVCRCANFAGSEYKKLPSTACGRYVLKLSRGGRTPSRFCSEPCRNRVNQRDKIKRRARDLATLRHGGEG
jgi:hypothetical protein